MDRPELYAAWTGADGYPPIHERPQAIAEHRDAINEYTNLSEPVPNGSNHEIRAWLDRFKGTVTRQLNDSVDGTDPHDEAEDAETPTDADTEGTD